MELTVEQTAIINSTKNLTIKAVAGSGMKTALIAYAKHNSSKNILFLAKDRSAKIKASLICELEGFDHVRVETAHSMSWKRIGYRGIKVMPSGYTPFQIRNILEIRSSDIIKDLKIAFFVGKLTEYFCNSAAVNIQSLKFEKTIFKSEELAFYWKNEGPIKQYAETFLQLMKSWKTPCIRDFYLKLYQLSNPTIQSDIILMDDAQDASFCMLDIFKKQNARKILIGDEHLQLHRKSFSVNALNQSDFPVRTLSQS